MGVLCWSLFWYALLYVLSSFAIILTRKKELVALLLLSFECSKYHVALPHGAVGWSVGLQSVTVVFLDHTHLILEKAYVNAKIPYKFKTGFCLREYRLRSCRPALQISVGFVRFGTFILGTESFLTQSGTDRYC